MLLPLFIFFSVPEVIQARGGIGKMLDSGVLYVSGSLAGWAGWALVTWLPICPSHHSQALAQGSETQPEHLFAGAVLFSVQGSWPGLWSESASLPTPGLPPSCSCCPCALEWQLWNGTAGHACTESGGVQVEYCEWEVFLGTSLKKSRGCNASAYLH